MRLVVMLQIFALVLNNTTFSVQGGYTVPPFLSSNCNQSIKRLIPSTSPDPSDICYYRYSDLVSAATAMLL
ncbi:hypothetical protein V8C35DRAFT_298764 [Trichoderma chlorosporum]